jgi:hypothetical protein
MRLRHRLAFVSLLVGVASLVGHGQTPPVFMPRELQEPAPTFRARVEAVAIDGVAFTLSLAGVQPGRYVLRIDATASEDHSATREIPVDVLEP